MDPGRRAFPEDDLQGTRILIKTSVGALAGRHARAHGGEGPLPDGRFHVIEASFAMAANFTGVQITPEFLSTATFFFVGSAD